MSAIAALLAAAAAALPSLPPAGSGKYPAIMELDPGLPQHTVYRPAVIPHETTLPIVVFAEGGCRNIGNRSRGWMTDLASHGYLVIVAGPPSPWTANDRDENEKPAKGAAVLSQPHQLVEAVDWAERENKRRGSRYFGRIDVKKVAAMGVSCGGIQALDFTVADARVTNVLMIYSGIFPDGVRPASTKYAGTEILRADVAKVTQPALYLYGGEKDIAYPNAEHDIDTITKAPVFAASLKASGHGDELRQPNGGRMGEVSIAWLDWWFRGDKEAGRQFTALDCPLCVDSGWSVKRKNLPAP